MFNRTTSDNETFLETKLGILTRQGYWFHTSRRQVEEFIPDLLDKVSLKSLINEAVNWVESSDSLGLILAYVLLFLINPWVAAAATLAFHWFWNRQKSAFVVYGVNPILKIINSDLFLFLLAFVSLTLFGYQGQYAALGIGIAFFFLMKPGLLRKGWQKLDRQDTNRLTLNDRVLKMVILKRAWHENLSPDNIEKMEDQIRSLAFSQKTGGT